jgi:hypothetical protein
MTDAIRMRRRWLRRMLAVIRTEAIAAAIRNVALVCVAGHRVLRKSTLAPDDPSTVGHERDQQQKCGRETKRRVSFRDKL